MISDAFFVKGIRGTDTICTDGIAHIAFVGRSNVGKSSLINALVGKKSLVKSGSTPGKTREINFFLATLSDGTKRYLVDLPGYGYAKLSAPIREKLRKLILWYITESTSPIQLIVLIIDAKVGLTDFDYDMISILEAEKTQYVIVANKSDKLNQKQMHAVEASFKENGKKVFFYSAKKRNRTDALLNYLELA